MSGMCHLMHVLGAERARCRPQASPIATAASRCVVGALVATLAGGNPPITEV
jgi:hypothetical protein